MKNTSNSFIILIVGLGKLSAQDNRMSTDITTMMMPNVCSWPEASRMAVKEINDKQGKPDRVTKDELIGSKRGLCKKISINKKETKHSFPLEQTDMMQTTISYKVLMEIMDELDNFDGSVTFDLTQRTMSARCEKEVNNFLALNLANDIITSKKSVEEARKAYVIIVK